MKRLLIVLIVIIFFFAKSSFAQQKFGEMDLPVRMTHTLGVSGNLGWNSLTGVGITLQYYIIPKIALDGGVGISAEGYKFSLRGRYIFLKKKFSPFVGAGFIYGTGIHGQSISLEDVDTGDEIIFEMLPSRFLQFVGGAEYVAKGGFFLMFNLGYAYLLNENINIISGSPSSQMKQVMRIAYGSGIVLEVSIGYIFKNKGYRGKL